MRRGREHLKAGAILLVFSVILVGCPKKPDVSTGGMRATVPAATARPRDKVKEEKIAPRAQIREVPVTPEPAERPEPGLAMPGVRESPLQDVFFEFDKAVLREDAKKALDSNIQWLKANLQVRIQVEGHCDERGTNEYNLALGERRASTVRDYLVAGGIDPKRISTISYGEEQPFVLGHEESAWKWNRRGHLLVVR